MADRSPMYLMRHGRTALDIAKRSDGWLDMPLTDEGRLGLIPAQQRLKSVPLKTIYTPSLKRTRETADIIASGTLSGPDVEEEDDSRTWNLGALAGTPKRYGRPEVQKLITNPNELAPGGESFNNFKGRFLPWFDKIVAEDEPVLIVCSGSNLRCLGHVLFSDASAIDLDESGLVVLWRSGSRWHAEILLGAKPHSVDGALNAVSRGIDDAEFES